MSAPATEGRVPPRRAVVLGASIAGLLAARVLSDHFEEVLLLDRDSCADTPAPRKGAPQAAHPHGLLARGRLALESLFPGLTDNLVQAGALIADLQRDIAFFASGRRLAAGTGGALGLCVSRPALEAALRRRVHAIAHVRPRYGITACHPVLDAKLEQVVAVRLYDDDLIAPPEVLQAALIVDCTGRGSTLPQWLAGWGFAPAPEETVDVQVCYASAEFARTGRLDIGRGFAQPMTLAAATPDRPRPGVMLALEPGPCGPARWAIAVGAYAGDHPDRTLDGLRARSLDTGASEIARVAHEGELLGPVRRYVFAQSVRRHYERMDRFPRGLLALGDALASFNPLYGQGMTVAACQAQALQRALQRGERDLAQRYFRAAARVVDAAWAVTVGGDLAMPSVPGHRPWRTRLLNAYVARVRSAAVHDAHVSRAFLRVVHLMAPPSSLLAPGVLLRVLAHAAPAVPPAGLPAPPTRPLHHPPSP